MECGEGVCLSIRLKVCGSVVTSPRVLVEQRSAFYDAKILKFGKGPSINGRACGVRLYHFQSCNLLKKLLVHGTEKLCSKFGEDRSKNDVTILSTDAGDRTCQMIMVILSDAALCEIGNCQWRTQAVTMEGIDAPRAVRCGDGVSLKCGRNINKKIAMPMGGF